MRMRGYVCAGLIAASGAAHADLMNISANGVHSVSLAAGACAIVGREGPLYRGTKVLYVFAESIGNGRDPALTLTSLKYNIVARNDDWQSSYYVNGVAKAPVPASLYSTFLRLPRRATDSAMIYFADPGEPVCASTNESASDANLYQVQISVSDMTATLTAAGVRSQAPGSAGVVVHPELGELMDAFSKQ